MTAERIVLQVGGQTFLTLEETLVGESDFFAARFSGEWNDPSQAGGSHFVDADPAIFVHILQYLQDSVLPTFYRHGKGFDHVLSFAVLRAAKYFQIRRLER